MPRGAAPQTLISKAHDLVTAYTVPDASTWDIKEDAPPNPTLQRFYKGLEAVAFTQPLPPVDSSREEYAALSIRDVKPALEEYMAAVVELVGAAGGGSGGGSSGATAGKKRKAEGPAHETDADEVELVRVGKLGDLKNDDLKAICRKRGLKLTGTKAEMVARIESSVKGTL